ncbi:MAG: transposase [Deltaproteobacteria bacterium]|nr:transposase [Deltaproteobacteria bacterium]
MTESPAKEAIIENLNDYLSDKKGPIFAYCVMPDHIHFLHSGKPDPREFMRRFKSATTTSLKKKGLNFKIWQRSFYDHGIRRYEGVLNVAKYIVHNPVRVGFVKSWEEWEMSYLGKNI